jgi:hypothetical protein
MMATLMAGSGNAARAAEPRGSGAPESEASHVYLSEFQPKRMLKVPETKVTPAKFPLIDVHTHTSFAAVDKAGVPISEKMQILSHLGDLLAVMDQMNIPTILEDPSRSTEG